MIGETINNRYEIEAELGQGGMGTVYRAKDATLKRDVAVKELSNFRLGSEGKAQLLAEAQTVAQLNHPNIVAVYDAGEHAGNPFIVMELVEGVTLREAAPEDLEAILNIASQMCAALEHAHQHDIVHRDIKPENINIEPDGTAKLMDFGIAHSVASRITSDGAIIGTVAYMAPEQAMGMSVDAHADLYSLGVVLYELTTSVLPYEDTDPIAIISQHIHAPLVPPLAKNEDLPPLLNDLIVELLNKDPDDRPSTAAEVLMALEDPDILNPQAAPAKELSGLDRIVQGRMVGRKAEFNQTKDIWSQASKGKGQLLMVSGEPGVGKTRMTREIITHAEVSGGHSFVGASFAEGGTPYAPVRQILRHALQTATLSNVDLPDAVLTDLLALVPDARTHFPQASDLSLDIQSDQDTLFEHITVFFNLLAAQSPLLVVLEDVHWADSGSLYLLRHLARNITAQPILLLGTYREVELDEALPFNETLHSLEREGLPTRIKLSRLTGEQTRDLLASMFEDEITDELLDGIYRETEGNPFFISEVCKALIESGKMFYENGKWDRPSIEEMGIPQSVRVAIQSRVAKLPENSQAVLTQAAVLGREFNFPTLKIALDEDEDTLIDALEDALDAQLIEELNGSGEDFAFSHALIPTSLVESLRTLKRRALHRRAARATLENNPDDVAALAHHYLEAGETEQAVYYLLKLGDQARALYAHQEAFDSYLQALDFLTEDYPRAANTQMKLALAYEGGFDFDAAHQAYERAFDFQTRAEKSLQAQELPPAPHPFRLPINVDPPSLDASLAVDVASIWFIDNLFSGLVELTPDLSILPDVAQRWEIQAGGEKYIFHLRDDVHWSDGQLVTAHDYRATFLRALEPEAGNANPTRFHEIKNAQAYHQGQLFDPNEVGVHALDDHTLEFELEGPCAFFLHLVAHLAYPVPLHGVEQHGSAWTDAGKIVTNGPFRLATWKPGVKFRFIKNPDYHRPFSGNLEEVHLVHASPEDMTKDYAEDQLDGLAFGPLPLEAKAHARRQYRQDFRSFPFIATGYISFDQRRPPFDDIRVRQAFALAVDREAVVRQALQGNVPPATGGFVPPGMPGHNPGIAAPFNPALARHLLEEAGFPNSQGFPKITALGVDTGFIRQISAALQDQWAEILGLTLSFEFIENYADFLEQTNTSPPHLWLAGWQADFPDPDNFLRATLWQRQSGWKNKDFESLVASAHRGLDQTERLQLYQQAESILIEETPIIPVVYGRFNYLQKPWVTKNPFSPIKAPTFKDIILEDH